MLGKGLESLIPQSQGDNNSPGSPHDEGQVKPQPAAFFPNDFVPAPPPNFSPSPEIIKKAKEEGKVAGSIFHIEVSRISPNSSQPRRNFDEAGIRELASSIREFGFLQPLVVSRVEKATEQGVDVMYELVAGERRLHAAKFLGLQVVPAIIRQVNLEREKLELAMIENIQREDLNPIETARAFERLQEEFRLTQREIASKLGKSRESVANTIRLLDLPPYIQESLEKGQLTESHGRFLLAVSNPGVQKQLFDDIVSRGLTTREVHERVRAITGSRMSTRSSGATLPLRSSGQADSSADSLPQLATTGASKASSPELKMMEEKLSSELGTPVKIETRMDTGGSSRLTTGKITITFYSEEELEGILKKIGGVPEG